MVLKCKTNLQMQHIPNPFAQDPKDSPPKKIIEFTKQMFLAYIWLVSNVVNNKRNWKLKLSLGAREKLIALTIWKH